MRLPQSESGRFLTEESVHNYERLLHSDVFVPCFTTLKNDFLAGNPLLKNEVFACIQLVDNNVFFIIFIHIHIHTVEN